MLETFNVGLEQDKEPEKAWILVYVKPVHWWEEVHFKAHFFTKPTVSELKNFGLSEEQAKDCIKKGLSEKRAGEGWFVLKEFEKKDQPKSKFKENGYDTNLPMIGNF